MSKTVADIVLNELLEPAEFEQGLICDESLGNIGERARFFRKYCESPIEFAFAMAFSDHTRVQTFEPTRVPQRFHEKTVVLIPQLKVPNYRLDFAVLFQANGRLHKWAIECDGREWHSSEAQVERDRKRDKFLAADGWRVLRYAGYLLHYGAGGMADRIHLEIDAFRKGYDAVSIQQYLDPEQFEEIGDAEAARWYRETKPLSYQQEDS